MMDEENVKSIVFITYSSWTPTVSLIIGILEEYAKKYNITVRVKESGKVKKSDILTADTILLVRPYDVSCADIAAAAKKCGKYLIVYLDDDLLEIPDLYSGLLRMWISRVLKTKNQRALRTCIEYCDILWGSNSLLLQKYKGHVRLGKCIKTDVVTDISDIQPVNRRSGSETRILFAGAADHAALLNKYIIPALNHLADEFPGIKMTCAGIVKSQLDPCRVPIDFIPWMNSVEDYRAIIRGGKYHIGIAVIEESDFYRCKYFNKFIEYSILGAVGLYTDSEPYRYVVRNGVNGFLVKSAPDDWAEKIAFAINNPQLCENCVYNAQIYIRENFQLEKILNQLKTAMPELEEKRGSDKKFFFYRRRGFWYFLRKTGMGVVNIFETLTAKRRK